MDLFILSDQLNTCLESLDVVHQMYSIIMTYKSEQSTKDTLLRGATEIPPLIARAIAGADSLSALLKEVPLTESSPRDAYRAVIRWLELVLYTTADYIPYLNEKNGQQLAVVHPISIWMYKEHRSIEACYYIGMHLLRLIEEGQGAATARIPLPLIRLPELVERFRTYAFPKMVEFHATAINQLKEVNPEYFGL